MLAVRGQGICHRTLGHVCPHAQFPRYLGSAASGDRGSTSLCASSSSPPTTRRVFAGLVSNTRSPEHDYLKLSRIRGALLPLPSSLPQHPPSDPRLALCFSVYRGIGPLAIAFAAQIKLPGAFSIFSILPDLQAATAERLPLSVSVPLSSSPRNISTRCL